MEFKLSAKVCKVDPSIGVVFGWAIVCEEDGRRHVDLQEDHISEAQMLKASAAFAKGAREAREMHEGGPVGTILFVFPLTGDIAKALELQTRRTGMLIGMRPDSAEVLRKFASGEYRGFSIGGTGTRRRVRAEVPA